MGAPKGPTKGFSIDALSKLSEMKSPIHPALTLLHFVAYEVLNIAKQAPPPSGGRLRSKCEPPALRLLRDELSLMAPASRILPATIQSQLEATAQETKMVANELRCSTKYEPEAVAAMQMLRSRGEVFLDELTASFSECERQAQEVMHFFGENSNHRGVSVLFSTLQEFVGEYSKAAMELCTQPKKFDLLLRSGEKKSTSPCCLDVSPNPNGQSAQGQLRSGTRKPRQSMPPGRPSLKVNFDGPSRPTACSNRLAIAGG